MVVLSKPGMEQFFPLVDLSKPESKRLMVESCEEYGFFKVINHEVPMDLISILESEAVRFFSLRDSEKKKAGPPCPFGYGTKGIGQNGDMGWLEYLLLSTTINKNGSIFKGLSSFSQDDLHKFQKMVDCYISAVKRMACQILEMMADGLKIQPRNVFSKLLMDKKSDSVFRLNHYPPCPELPNCGEVIGFGEHTDPQIISILRSNNTSGLQIFLGHGNWVSVPPDYNSFFVNVGDSLQVMTNGRFKSVRHRVMANSSKSRVSMIYFGGPPLREKIAPVASLIKGDQESLYKEFTWFEYKKYVYTSKLADNRLELFERIAAL